MLVCDFVSPHVFSLTVAAVDAKKRGYVGMCNGRSAQQESGAALSKNSMFTASLAQPHPLARAERVWSNASCSLCYGGPLGPFQWAAVLCSVYCNPIRLQNGLYVTK